MDIKFNSAEEAKRFWREIREDKRKKLTSLIMTCWSIFSFVSVFVGMGNANSAWLKLSLVAALVFIGFSGFLYALSPWAAEK